MSKNSSKNTKTYQYFQKALEKKLGLRDDSHAAIAKTWKIPQSTLETSLNKYASLATMERIAQRLDIDLVDLLLEGRGLSSISQTPGRVQRDRTVADTSPASTTSPAFTLVPAPPPLRAVPDGELESDYYQVPFRDDMRLAAGKGEAPEGFYEIESSPVIIHKSALKRRSVASLAAFRVGGPSMEPTIVDGSIVVVDLSQKEIKDGFVYMLDLDPTGDGENSIKRLSWAEKDRLLMVESDNPAYKPKFYKAQDVNLHGRVVWAWGEF